MTDLTFDDMFDVPAEKQPIPARPSNQSWIISPEVQAQRDAAAGALLRAEAGGAEGLRNRIKLIEKEMQTANPDLKAILATQKKLHQAGLSAPDRQVEVSKSDELTFDDMFEPEKPQQRSELAIQLRGIQAGGAAILKEAGTIGDMLIGDVPGAVLGVAANALSKFYARPEGVSRKAAAIVQRDIQQEVTEKYSPHLFSKFAALFAPPGDEGGEGHLEKSMAALMTMTEKGAEKVEKATGGALTKEDVQVLVDETFALLGVKGVELGTQAALNRALARDPKSAKKVFAVDEAQGVPGMAPGDVPIGKAVVRALPPEEMGALRATEQKALTAKRKDVEAAVREDPAWADQLETIAESAVRSRELARVEQERLAISESAPRTRPAQKVEAQERPQALETQLRPYQNLRLIETSPLDSGLQKVAKGQGFALTAEELAAIRTSKSVWNRPEIAKGQADVEFLAALALGTTGASLAMFYPDEAKTGFGLAAAGAILTPGRGVLTLDAIAKMPEGRTLGTILKESPYTFKTLELPELQNRVDIPKSMLEQALRREGVTKAERDTFTAALELSPKDFLTAKELMHNLKVITQDWELKPQDVDTFADYGLENIGRNAKGMDWEPDVPDAETIRRSIQRARDTLADGETQRRASLLDDSHFPDYPNTPGQARRLLRSTAQELQESLLELESRLAYDEAKANPENRPIEATRTDWNVPDSIDLEPLIAQIEFQPGGHVYGRRALGHTRSFDEGGTRHVVEVQSNLAQYAEKPLSQAEVAQYEISLRTTEAAYSVVLDAYNIVRDLSSTVADYVKALDLLETGHSADVLSDVKLRVGQDIDRYFNVRDTELAAKFDELRHSGDFEAIYDLTKETFRQAAASKRIDRGSLPYLSSAVDSVLYNESHRLEQHRDTLARKLGSSKVQAKLGPLLKDWPKRLIREELAAGAYRLGELQNQATRRKAIADGDLREIANNPGMPEEMQAKYRKLAKEQIEEVLSLGKEVAAAGKIRFATADTVAKVEGWHEVEDLAVARANYERIVEATQTQPDHPLRLAEEALYQEALKAYETGQRFAPEHQGIYNRYRREIEKFLNQLGGKPYTDSKGHTWIEVPVTPGPKGKRAQMFGGANTELLAAIAAAGAGGLVGAYLTDDKTIGPAAGALLGALAVYKGSKYAAVREVAADLIDKTDYTLGAISTRIHERSPALHRRQLDFELSALANGHKNLEASHEFIKAAKKLKGDEASAFKRAALTNDPAILVKTLEQIGSPELTRGWSAVRGILDEQGKTMHELGLLKSVRENYFPRAVKDKAGLFEKLGKEERTFLESRLARAEAAMLKATGRGLTEFESAAIINEYLSTSAPIGSRPGFMKKRTIGEITKELEPFYEDPAETLVSYIRSASSQIEKAKFFGKHLKKTELEGRQVVDIEKSIGALTDDLLQKGELTPEGVDEVRSILNSRFGPGEASSWWLLQDFRNAAYTGLLGNAVSAAVQVTDIGINVGLRGLLPTLEAVGRKLAGRQALSVRDMGLLDHVAEEFAGQRPSSKMLRLVFKGAGFTALDAFSKDVAVNSALIHRKNQLKSAKGEARFDSDLERFYGEDLAQLKSDLRSGAKTDLTNSLAFAELSRTQPVSRAEMPQAYLDNPNGRTFYMLKTYSLKQIDLLRRESYMKIKEGKTREGLTNLARIGTAFMLAGATSQWVSDWMSGRGFDPSWEDLPKGFFKTFGLSQYVLDTAQTRGPSFAVGNIVTPPTKMIDDILLGKEKAVRYIPFGGRLYYEHNLGGAEAYKAREVLKRREEERNVGLSDDEKKRRAERLKERAAARRRRLAEEY